jgi:26S proteasome regulatory subunit N1
VRNLAGEISAEFQHREEQDADVKDLLNLVSQIVPYHMSHNAEPDAVDLLLEVEKLKWLAQYVDDKNYSRTCLYLVSCCAYLAEPDDTAVLRTAYDLYIKCSKYVDAMRIALRMNNHELILSTMTSCPDNLHKKQLAFLLARHGVLLMYEEEEEDAMEDAPQVIVAGTAHMTPVTLPHTSYQYQSSSGHVSRPSSQCM